MGAVLVASLECGCGSEGDAEPIEVAVAVPLSGNSAMLDAARAWTLVEESVNAAGGIDGRALEVHTFDTPLRSAEDLSPIAQAFAHIAELGYHYVISIVAGQTVAPIMERALPSDVLAMSITAEERSQNLPSYEGLLLRATLPMDTLLEQQARTLQARGERHLLLVGPEAPGGPSLRHRALERAFGTGEDLSAASLTYPAEQDPYYYDWAGFGERSAELEFDSVYLSDSSLQALMDSVRTLEVRGYRGAYYFAYGGLMSELAPIFWDTAAPRFRSFELALPPGERLDQFERASRSRFERGLSPEPRLVAAADMLGLLSLALVDVGEQDPRAVAESMRRLSRGSGAQIGPLDFGVGARALRAGEGIGFSGVTGPVDFDEVGDVLSGRVAEYELGPDGLARERP